MNVCDESNMRDAWALMSARQILGSLIRDEETIAAVNHLQWACEKEKGWGGWRRFEDEVDNSCRGSAALDPTQFVRAPPSLEASVNLTCRGPSLNVNLHQPPSSMTRRRLSAGSLHVIADTAADRIFMTAGQRLTILDLIMND